MVIRRNGGGLAALGLGVLTIGAAILSALPATGAAAATTSVAATTAGGRLVCPQQLPPSENVELAGVATVSVKSAWSVGFNDVGPVVEHFDGTKWSLVKKVPAADQFSLLLAAAPFSGGAWAVGTSGTPAESGKPTILRLTGASTVQSVKLPKLGVGRLVSVSVVSAKDAWASGFLGKGGRSLVMHWNGTAWKQASFPGKGVTAILGISANNAWATTRNENAAPTMWNWNGKNWRKTTLPAAISKPGYALRALSASSAKDVWSVGDFLDSDVVSHTVAVHWNGVKWSAVTTPPVPMTDGPDLFAVAALSPRNAWAVGDNIHFPAVIEHWDGTSWKVVKSPACGGLEGISLAPGGNGFAVGVEPDAQDGIPVIFQKTGNTWKSVPVGA